MSDLGANDEPGAEFELHKEVEHEVGRLLHNPRGEPQRLHAVAEEGESAATPVIEIVAVARRVIPFAILVIVLVFAVYYAARQWA